MSRIWNYVQNVEAYSAEYANEQWNVFKNRNETLKT